MDAKDRTGIRGDRLPFFDAKGVYVRPKEETRAFRSAAVDALVAKVTAEIPDAKFKTLFANCYPNTLDTTVSYRALPDGDDDTFVYTGDIPAMWLRDSSAQVWPYLPLAKDDEPLRKMIRGVLRRQFRSILIDPYANAFNPDASGRGHPDAPTEMKPEIWERKYEIDSLCYPIRLAYGYWKETGDASVFDATWLAALDKILETFRTQQHKQGWKTPYRFAGDGVPNHGYGAPVKPVGLIASFFRPSDDACVYPFLVPSNFFAVDVLKKAAEIVRAVNRDTERMRSCHALAHEVETALGKYAVVKHPKYGDIYAYEIDGFGNALLIDDANVPSLLALPYFSEVKKDDPVYLNTRRFVFSADNPYYFEGRSGAGIGGPHCGFDRIWPMSYVFKALTATDDADIVECLRLLRASDAGRGLMHESYDKDDPSVFSRAWFAWANSIFGELIIILHNAGKLHLLQAASVEKTVAGRTVKVSSFGYDAADSTRFLQAAFDSGAGRVVIDRQAGDWIARPLFITNSNVEVVLEDGVNLVAKRGEFHGHDDCLVEIRGGASNVTLRGEGKVTLRMGKADYLDPEWHYMFTGHRMTVNILKSRDVRVRNLTILSSGGDGVYVGSGADDVVLEDLDCRDHYRQGISITDASRVTVRRCSFNETTGTPPTCGVDLEPNVAANSMSEILFEDCAFNDNAAHGVLLYFGTLAAKSRPVSVTFRRCECRGNRRCGISLMAALPKMLVEHGPVRGTVLFEDCRVSGNGQEVVKVVNHVTDALDVRFRNCDFDARGMSVDAAIMFSNAQLLRDFGGLSFENCRLTLDETKVPCDFEAQEGIGIRGPLVGTLAVTRGAMRGSYDLADCAAKNVPHPERVSTFKSMMVDFRKVSAPPASPLKGVFTPAIRESFVYVQAVPGAGEYKVNFKSAKLRGTGDGKPCGVVQLLDRAGTDLGKFNVPEGDFTYEIRTKGPDVYRFEVAKKDSSTIAVSSETPGGAVLADRFVSLFGGRNVDFHFRVPATARMVTAEIVPEESTSAELLDAGGRKAAEMPYRRKRMTFNVSREPTAADEIWTLRFPRIQEDMKFRLGGDAVPLLSAEREGVIRMK